MGPDEKILEQFRAIVAQNAAVMARLNAHLQATIPVWIEETALSDEIDVSTTSVLTIAPSRDTYFKCTGLYVSLPFGVVAAQLQLGSQFVLPLQNTTTEISPIQKILRSTDLRQLTFTTGSANGGRAFVWLFGDAVPSYGKM